MEDPSSVRAVPLILPHEKATPVPESYGINDKGHMSEGSDSSVGSVKDDHSDRLRCNKVTVAFFLIGLLIGLPSMVVTTGANEMFTGITGVYEVCASLTGAITSLVTPFFARFISYNRCTMICIIASLLSYVICTLPHPLDDSSSDSKAGPVIGVALAGFVYAFGTNIYMAVAAFFPSEAVLALSAGSGFSVIVGPALYIAFMAGFGQDWRRTFLVFLPTALGIPIVWLTLMDKSRLAAAEKSRLGELEKKKIAAKNSSSSAGGGNGNSGDVEAAVRVDMQEVNRDQERRRGFGSHRTRMGLLFKVIIPKYVLPLVICTTSAIITLLGTSPTLQALERFRARPEGDLQFQLVFLSYGIAQFLFSALTSIYPVPIIWFWTGTQVTILAIGIIQIFQPFLTYYGVWIVFLFLVGACVGGGVTNTNYKIARDFQRAGEPDEVRSFAMSFAGLGNFGGDAIGGALATMVQQLAVQNLRPSS